MKKFWNKEYKRFTQPGGEPTYLALSTEPAEDLEKFTRWLERSASRRNGRSILNPLTKVLDLGCGNGRNLIYLAKNFGCHGVGYDNSSEAIKQAKGVAETRTILNFEIRSIREPILLPDNSINLVLDMMTSHILRAEERQKFRQEIIRVLKTGGWLLFKTFLLEDDDHAKRLLREHPAGEPNSYIHPKFKVFEHVWTIFEIKEFFSPNFEVHKIEKSRKHRSHGRAFRRRTVTVYLQKRD